MTPTGTRAYTLTVLGHPGPWGTWSLRIWTATASTIPGGTSMGSGSELYRSDQVAGVDEPLDFLVTANGGKYVFSDIRSGCLLWCTFRRFSSVRRELLAGCSAFLMSRRE